MTRGFFIALILAGAGTQAEAGPSASTAQRLAAKEKLLELAVRPPTVAFEARKLVVSLYGDKSRAREVRVYYQPPDKWRHDVLDPSGRVVKTIIQKGAKEWLYQEGAGAVLLRNVTSVRHGEMNRDDLKDLLSANFTISDAGKGTHVGVATRGVSLRPRADAGGRRHIWVDPKTGIVMHRRQANSKGRRVQESRITWLNVQDSIPDEMFDPRRPNTEIIEESERPLIKNPEELAALGFPKSDWRETLPFGYRLDSVRILKLYDKPIAHFRYSNGLSSFSYFLSPYLIDGRDFKKEGAQGSDDADAEMTSVSWAGDFLSWKKGKYYYLIVGDVSSAGLKEIRRALEAHSPGEKNGKP